MRRHLPILSPRAWAAAAILLFAQHARAESPKRPLPDYAGREEAPTTAGEAALWAPRITLAPAYLASEYVVRRPLGAAIAGAERAGLPEAMYNFFFFGPDHKAGFVPIAFADFGFHPDVGVYTFWDDAFFKGHDLRLHATTGFSSEWLAGVFTDRLRFHGGESVALELTGIRRPDLMFFGVGPNATKSSKSRYGEDRLEARVLAAFPLWRASRVETSVGVRSMALHHGHFGGDPSLEDRAAQGAFPIPYGFDRGYTAQTSHVLAALDSRRPSPAPGSGIRVELEAEEGADVRRSPGSAWVRYGATAGAFVDLNGHNRVLSFSLTTQLADPLGHAPIPFTELVSLGGSGPMRGFYPGRLVDRSAAVATVRYRWPIWVWLDGSIQAATGNVFGAHLDHLDPSRFRLSGAVGVESIGSRDSSFELLIGVGTETFDQGGKLDSVRISVGTNRGF